ncbi:hypothetical protein ACH5RR_001790 [Cinchona calisaya]|uniref:Cytochrome P450 n=1 Tax=Cinchona calisaya TaxID=153742 RepID=A0ABD3B4G9_9GENT
MEWALSVLLNNPEALNKAQQEINTQTGRSRLINDSDLDHLPYLQAIIKVTLRIHESAQECTVGGYRIPHGTLLFANLWAMQNDPKIWEEPTRFKPERFMNWGVKKDGLVYMPFGLAEDHVRGRIWQNELLVGIGITYSMLRVRKTRKRLDGYECGCYCA